MNRAVKMRNSNNKDNPKQNLCIKAVCEFLGVNNEYLHTLGDLIEAVSGPYQISTKRIPHQYILVIRGNHCALLDNMGMTLVDTAPNVQNVQGIRKVYYVN